MQLNIPFTFTWDINGTISSNIEFQWDIGDQALHYYLIEGNWSGGGIFTEIIAATSLADLCTRMKEVYLNYPITGRLTILRHSRPVYLDDVKYTAVAGLVIDRLPDGTVIKTYPDGTVVTTAPNGTVTTSQAKPSVFSASSTVVNDPTKSTQQFTASKQIAEQLPGLPEAVDVLQPQVYCHIPECFEFCLGEDHVVRFSGTTNFQDSFLNYVTSGGFSLDGINLPNLDSNTNPLGGFVLGGSSVFKSNRFVITGSGGLVLSSDDAVSSSAWHYHADGDLDLSGMSPTITSNYQYFPSGDVFLSGHVVAGKTIVFNPVSPNIVFGGTMPPHRIGYITKASGGLVFTNNHANATSSNYIITLPVSGLKIGAEASIVSSGYVYRPAAGLELGSATRIGFAATGRGGIGLAGSNSPGYGLHYRPNSGFVLGGGFIVDSSPSWAWRSQGGLALNGVITTNYQVFPEISAEFSAAAELTLFEAVLPPETGTSVPIVPDTSTITGTCGCNPIPIMLQMAHNFGQASILSNFLLRNGFTLPVRTNLIYNKNNSTWRSSFHFNGTGNEVSETWRFIFEWGCVDELVGTVLGVSVWKFSVLISRVKKLSPTEREETRILYVFPQEAVCANNSINFSFSIDTNTGEVVLPKNLITQDAVIHDDIGLFSGATWLASPELEIDIFSSNSQTSVGVVNLEPLLEQ